MYNFAGGRRVYPLHEYANEPDPDAFEMPYPPFSVEDEDLMKQQYQKLTNQSKGLRTRFVYSMRWGLR